MPDNSNRIREIRDTLEAGATSVSTDGTNVTFDFEELRKELRRLEAEDTKLQGRRPVAASIYLGGF